MLQAIQTGYRKFFSKGHERTLRARKNIVQSILTKILGVAISFALIPLTIQYVNATNYGIWLTLNSIITWAALFDLGLGNGLKNKLAADFALNNLESAKNYLSSTYAILTVISLMLLSLFWFINPYINWHRILNVPYEQLPGLNYLVAVIFAFFCLQFVVQLINTVTTANQAPVIPVMLNVSGQILTLAGLLFLMRFFQSSLTYLIYIMIGAPLTVLIIASIWLYNGAYRAVAPDFRFINLAYARQILSTGGAFFVIQIGALILYETDNIVITQLFGPKEVTAFNIAYKLFSVIIMFAIMVITPFWSAFTEAFAKNDFDWIKKTINKMKKLWLGLSFVTVLLIVCSPLIYRLWLGDSIAIPFSLSLSMGIYTITLIWQAMYVQFLNGIYKVKLQLYLSVLCSIINIPVSIILGKQWGLPGITASNIIIFIVMGFAFSIQTKKILNGTASGIFNA